MRKNNAGFSLVEMLLVFAVVTLLAFIGYRVWSAKNSPTAADSKSTSQATPQYEAPQINDAAGLNQASSTLDVTNIDGNTSSKLDSQLSY